MKLFKLIFLIIGLGLLAWTFQEIEIEETLDLISNIGFGFLLVLAVYFVAFLFDTLTWQLTVLSVPVNKKWTSRFFLLRLAGEAFNNILPAASLGGEPVKAFLLKNIYGLNYREGIASLILARTINTLALVLLLIIGFILMINSNIFDEGYNQTAGVGLGILSFLIVFFFFIQRFKVTSLMTIALSKIQMFRWLERSVHYVAEIDDVLSRFYVNHSTRANSALTLAFVNWVLGVIEIYIIMEFIGHPISLADAWILESAVQLVRTATFFIPASIGAQETVFLIIGSAVTGSPTVGFTAAIVKRAREVIWIIVGLLVFYTIKSNTSNKNR